MKAVFADTFYFLALLNTRDPAHERAWKEAAVPDRRFLTTEFVLLELADALCKPPLRQEFDVVRGLIEENPAFRLVPASSELLRLGLARYRERQDKEWQLTDCISFLVMEGEGVTTALTGDRHFEQAGFSALLTPG